jgi:DNA-binding response OmpR family regulator
MSAKTILITDDEPHMRRLLEFSIRKTGHNILQADSGEAALAIIEAQPIDLLLIDFGLTGITGLDTIRAIRQKTASVDLPVVLITARGDTGIRTEAEASNISAFITKPFSPIELSALVQKIIGS